MDRVFSTWSWAVFRITLTFGQLPRVTVPIAVSIAFFDAAFFVIADIYAFTGRQIALGVLAAAIAGLYVLIDYLQKSAGLAGDLKSPIHHPRFDH